MYKNTNTCRHEYIKTFSSVCIYITFIWHYAIVHRLKTSPTKSNYMVLASISKATFSIKMVWKLKLLYPLLFINIHKGTKKPISVNQQFQPKNINWYSARYVRGTKGLTVTKTTCENVYGNTHISKIRHYETTLQLTRASKHI